MHSLTRHTWKKAWFILRNHTLYKYHSPTVQ